MLSPQGDQGFLSRIESNPSVHPLITFENTAVLPPSVMVFSLSQLSTVKRDFCPPCALWSIRARTCDQASHFYFSTFHHFWMKSGIYPHSWKCSSCIWKIWCEVCSTHENMKYENMRRGMLNPCPVKRQGQKSRQRKYFYIGLHLTFGFVASC